MCKLLLKFVIVFSTVSVLANSVLAWGRGDLEKYGPFQLVLNSKLIKCEHDRNLNLDISLINVYFYDFAKDIKEVHLISGAAKAILNSKNFDRSKKLIVFVPGYKSAIHKNTEQKVRDAFKSLPNSYLIIIDHSPYTNDKLGYIKSYERSVKYVYYIGEAVGKMLAELSAGGLDPRQIHCIGHSLGSQMLSHTGELFKRHVGKDLPRITALDPAGPCFSKSLKEEQIRSGVAEYVEVYHCNAGGLGTTSVLGDIDIFVNKKGATQPNCGTPLIPGVFDSSKAAKCSHKACVTLFMETVNNPELYWASKCDNYKMFKGGMCSRNDVTVAGFWNPGNATGVFYLNTES